MPCYPLRPESNEQRVFLRRYLISPVGEGNASRYSASFGLISAPSSLQPSDHFKTASTAGQSVSISHDVWPELTRTSESLRFTCKKPLLLSPPLFAFVRHWSYAYNSWLALNSCHRWLINRSNHASDSIKTRLEAAKLGVARHSVPAHVARTPCSGSFLSLVLLFICKS